MPVAINLFAFLCCCWGLATADDHNALARGPPGKQANWNPFQNAFSFNQVPNAPAGFGQFPAFGGGGGGFGGNTGFGGFGGGGDRHDHDHVGDNRRSGMTGFGGENGFGGGFGGFSGGFGGFPDFSGQFANFQKQFATQFPNFWPAAGNTVVVAPVVAAPPLGSTPVENSGNNEVSPPVVVATQPPPMTLMTTTITTTTVATTAATMAAAIVTTASPANSGNSFTIVNRNCSVDGQVIGLSQSPSDICGSVECQCFKGVYFCYSTCSPPPAGQSCTPTIPADGSNICPTYSGCTSQDNSTGVGAGEIFRCSAGPVHPSVCWLYEILFGKLTEPYGFFESVAQGCSLSNQCVCGPNGFVQAASMQASDFKTPADNTVFVRTTPGNKGAFASS